jgi:hypothetical protein
MTFLETLSLDLSVIAFVLAVYIAAVATLGPTFLRRQRRRHLGQSGNTGHLARTYDESGC